MGPVPHLARAQSKLLRFQQPIVAVFKRSNEIPLRTFESAPAKRLAEELCPAVCAVLREARSLLGAILSECSKGDCDVDQVDGTDALRSSYLPFERAVDLTMEARGGSPHVVEEVAFIAQLELRQREERLERARVEHGAVLLLGEADSSLRRIRKALSAVESAVASVEGVDPQLVFTSETELSIAVRRAYAKFRARLQVGKEPADDDLYGRFRGAGTQIAMLIGWDVYPDLRVRDRLVLCDLQQRILSWLRTADASTAIEGRRLWQDLVACVEMFALISRRQELTDHDALAIPDALARLRENSATISVETWELLESLEGLDQELDALLSSRPRLPPAAYVEPLERLSRSFVRPSVRPAARSAI